MSTKKVTYYLFLSIQLLLFAVFLVFFFIVASPILPTKNILATFAVVSGSMEPSVPVGALAFVRSHDTRNLSTGDVIAFPEPGNPKRTILHRITERRQSGSIVDYKTKGDNNPEADLWSIEASQIRGQMLFAIPALGYPILYAQTPIGFGVLIGIPAAAIMALELKSIHEGIEEEIQKRVLRQTQAATVTV